MEELTEEEKQKLIRAAELIIRAAPLLEAAEKHPLLRRILGL